MAATTERELIDALKGLSPMLRDNAALAERQRRPVDEVMQACPNVWTELSARDPWRYINNPVTGDDAALLPDWRSLLERHPDRFLVGSDPVWPVEQLDG